MVKHRSLIKSCEKASCPLRRSCRAREGWPLSAGRLPQVLQPHSLQQAAGVFWKIMPTDRGRAGPGDCWQLGSSLRCCGEEEGSSLGSWGRLPIISCVAQQPLKAAVRGGLQAEGQRSGSAQLLPWFHLVHLCSTHLLKHWCHRYRCAQSPFDAGGGCSPGAGSAVPGRTALGHQDVLVGRLQKVHPDLALTTSRCFKIFKSTAILHISFPIWKPEKTRFSPGSVASVPGLIFKWAPSLSASGCWGLSTRAATLCARCDLSRPNTGRKRTSGHPTPGLNFSPPLAERDFNDSKYSVRLISSFSSPSSSFF